MIHHILANLYFNKIANILGIKFYKFSSTFFPEGIIPITGLEKLKPFLF